MRLVDIPDFFRLRRFTSNPLEICRFRNRQKPGDVLEVRLHDRPSLYLRGGMSDFHMFHRIFLRDEYRLNEVSPKSWDCVIDLGANVGLFSARACELARRVYAYEPFPDNHASLDRNLGTREGVIIVREAAAARPGTLRLYEPKGRSRTGAFSSFTEMDVTSEAFCDVPCITLNLLFERHKIDACDLLKIDIEGQEYEVLHAANDGTISKIRRIHGEYHDVEHDNPLTRIDNFTGFLRSKGFEVDVAPHRRKSNHGMFYASRT